MDAADPEKSSARAPGEHPSLAVRWGRWVARRRRLVLSIWGVILVLSALAYPHLMNSLVASDYSVTGSDSAEVTKLLSTDFSAAGAEQDVIVFQSDTLTIRDPAYVKAVDGVMAAVEDEPGVVAVLGPTDRGAQGQVSDDGHAAIASVGLSGSDRDRAGRASDIQDAVADAAAGTPVAAYLTGYSPSANDLTEVENADVERAESIGIPIAFIVLLLALGGARRRVRAADHSRLQPDVHLRNPLAADRCRLVRRLPALDRDDDRRRRLDRLLALHPHPFPRGARAGEGRMAIPTQS